MPVRVASARGSAPQPTVTHRHQTAQPPPQHLPPQPAIRPAPTHRLRMKYSIIAISRLMARYLVACTLVLSYTLTATRLLVPSLGHTAL